MEMTEEEIVRSYRLACNPKKQIGILADINATNTTEIRKILEKRGAIAREKGLVSKSDFEESEKSTETPAKRKYTRKPKEEDTAQKVSSGKKIAEMLNELSGEQRVEVLKEDVKAGNGSSLPDFVKEALQHEIAAISADIADLTIEIERKKAKREAIEEYIRLNGGK